MAIERKYIFAGITLVTVTTFATVLYMQYNKIMNYIIKFNGIAIRKLGSKIISFDLFINFTNTSDISMQILGVSTKIYINDKFVSHISNNNPIKIASRATSVLGVNISIVPSDVLSILGTNYLAMISNPQSITIKSYINIRVKLWFFAINIPYIYNTTLKKLISIEKSAS